ncbi:MAG: isochorismatase family protein [Bacteroidales bacterium]|nr:MAG: isochorismatase family protein [Bacteroidales bacterium]
MQFNNVLMIIDMQNDFCMPDGALYIPGAEKDLQRTAGFIRENGDYINHIILTQDNHQVVDISHPSFWKDKQGNHPEPSTRITAEDIEKEVWIPEFEVSRAKEYIRNLEKEGEFPHTIWPEHCIQGSRGAAIADIIMVRIIEWARKGKHYDLIVKGTNPLTEHFGALRANIPDKKNPETQLNTDLLNTLRKFNNIFIAGEARSHCVANTVKQLLEFRDIANKIILLQDCMSDIPGMEHIADPIYSKAKNAGVTFSKSRDINLKIK